MTKGFHKTWQQETVQLSTDDLKPARNHSVVLPLTENCCAEQVLAIANRIPCQFIGVDSSVRINNANLINIDSNPASAFSADSVICVESLNHESWISDFVKSMFERNKLVALAGRSVNLIHTANGLKGRNVTGCQTVKSQMLKCGARWRDEIVCRSRNLVTARHDTASFVETTEAAIRQRLIARAIAFSPEAGLEIDRVISHYRLDASMTDDCKSSVQLFMFAKLAHHGHLLADITNKTEAVYLRQIIRSGGKTFLKREFGNRPRSLLDHEDSDPLFTKSSSWTENQKHAVIRCLGQFPPQDRILQSLLEWKFFVPTKHQEMAEQLNVSQRTIRRYLTAAESKLRDLLLTDSKFMADFDPDN